MRRSNFNIDSLSEEDVREIRNEVNRRLGQYNKTNQIIKEDIFKILEMNCNVIYFPIEDDEICGFLFQYRDKKFVYINTYIPYEKQVFVAAHELYHIWNSDIRDGELLKIDVIEGNSSSEDSYEYEEDKANRFGAEFLVPRNVLINELELRNIDKGKIDLREIVELMDVFLVPYKTIVRRLYEIKYITTHICSELLKEPDREENAGVMLWQKRLEVGSRNNERTKRIKLNNLVDLSLKLFEKKLITYDKLEYLLGLSKYSPKDFNILRNEETLPSEDELLKLMEEED